MTSPLTWLKVITGQVRQRREMAWFYCYNCTTIHFNNLFLHRSRKSRCIRTFSGQAVVNSGLESKIVAIPGQRYYGSRATLQMITQTTLWRKKQLTNDRDNNAFDDSIRSRSLFWW